VDAERQRDLLAAIFNASSDGLLLYDESRQITAANTAVADLLGLGHRDLVEEGAGMLQLDIAARSEHPETYYARLDAHFIAGDRVHQDRLVILRPRRRVIRRSSRPVLTNGRPAGRVFTYTDMTTEADVDRIKTEFVSMASHELRTPLTSIHGALQLALAGSAERLEAEDREMLEISLKSTERMVRLVNQLLDLSRIEAGARTMVPGLVDPAELLHETVKAMQVQAVDRQVRLEVSSDDRLPKLHGCHDDLARVLVNLLSNAITYSPRGSTIRATAARTPDGIEFSVTDCGPGVPSEHVDRLFKPFSRVGVEDRQVTGGTGLGLAISRAIVDQHGGRIWVEPSAPTGCRFAFVIPPAPATRVRVRS
jgi:signal transduction histidine kinase